MQGKFPLHAEFTAGAVSAALKSASGRIYTGINIDVACGIGFCAEHAAVADMLKHRETVIAAILAVSERRHSLPLRALPRTHAPD